MSQRARRDAAKRVGKDAEPVAVVARDLGVGWHTVMRTVVDHGRSLADKVRYGRNGGRVGPSQPVAGGL